MDAAGVIAYYVMDGNRPLTSESAGNTTFFLYGRGVIGEKTTDWNFSLPDGTNTPRQLSDSSGDITLAARYTPWGNSLELHGTGNPSASSGQAFTFGYIGSILDTATGLLYVGNGQYYDPSTGRFLTRGVNPDAPNPYVPWNPIGAIIGPLALFSLVARRRKSKANPYLMMLMMLVVLPLSVAMACGSPAPAPTEEPPSPSPSPTPVPSPTPTPSPTPVPSPTDPPDPCIGCTSTPSPSQTPHPREFVGNFNLSGYYTPVYEEQFWTGGNKVAETDPNNESAIFWGKYLTADGLYTDNVNWAISAKEGFLGHDGGICTQGSGIINGRVIFCSTPIPETKFAWGPERGDIEQSLSFVQAYQTVARCGSKSILKDGWTIYIDADWLNDDVLGAYNTSKELKVTDTGNAPALCGEPEGIDIYFGRGLSAFNAWKDFNKMDNEKSTQYWPVYRIIE